uniref:Cadherin domain-containing protein n=1 Tax=Rhodnius prolixus TaxID=13249 RepID=T1IAW8_RHOPR
MKKSSLSYDCQTKVKMGVIIVALLAATSTFALAEGCQFYPLGEYLRFVRVPESLPVGDEVLLVEVHPRRNLTIQPVDQINSYLSATVYVEDVNDHGPTFVDAPYHVNVDELTPTGLTVFRGIHAVDMDKPNTPNSEIIYSLTGGNTGSKFSLEMQGQRPALVLKKGLDYDQGDKQFKLIVTAMLQQYNVLIN